MARAFIVVNRNDLPDNFLQTLDLWPNTSHRNYAVQPPGQTHYNSHFLLDGTNANIALAGAGPITVTGDTYGLSAYLVGNVEGNPGAVALTAPEAIAIAGKIETRVAMGLSLTLADINAILQIEAGVATTLTTNNSTGSVEEILRVLSGERWLIQNAAAIADAGPNFVVGVNGEFVLRPLVELPESVRDSNGLAVRGRNPFSTKTIPTSVAGQDTAAPGITDLLFNDVLVVRDTGSLHRSAINGALAKMANSTFSWKNEAFTYGGGATPAFDLSGTNIAAVGATAFQARAVTVYAADGSVIV